jgi:hypothetical protein
VSSQYQQRICFQSETDHKRTFCLLPHHSAPDISTLALSSKAEQPSDGFSRHSDPDCFLTTGVAALQHGRLTFPLPHGQTGSQRSSSFHAIDGERYKEYQQVSELLCIEYIRGHQ